MKELNLCKTFKLCFYFLCSVGSSHCEHWKKPDSKIVVWHLHQQNTELHEQLHWFEDGFLSASTFPMEQLVCWKTSTTISGFQVWGLKCVLCILYSAHTIRLFHEISWIHLKKRVVFARFSTRETWACFPGDRKKILKCQLKANLPKAILYLVKLHDSSLLEILQWYHKVHFLLVPSRFLTIQGIQFSESSLISKAAIFPSALDMEQSKHQAALLSL